MAAKKATKKAAKKKAKAQRSDAVRNRERVLDAAARVFERLGTGASTEAIAAEAGVGVGTVFRHFPTKELLLEAVLHGAIDALADAARAALDDDDAGAAFFGVLTRMVERSATKRAVADALAAAGVEVKRAQPSGLRDAIGALLVRAQKAGAVRRDVGTAEVMAVVVAASRAIEHIGGGASTAALRERTVRVLFDGLRAGRSKRRI